VAAGERRRGADGAWEALAAHFAQSRGLDLREAFGADPGRAERLRVSAAGLTLDYSKNLVTERTIELLCELARTRELPGRVRAQLGGAMVNGTEERAVLHTALRGTDAGERLPQAREVQAVRKRMAELARRVRAGDWAGWTGEPVRDVVNIGIGGSHLGPAFATEALGHLRGTSPRCHFVSNVDPRDLEGVLTGLAPARTLFIVASKTFGTLETLENARSARRWLQGAGCPDAALSTSASRQRTCCRCGTGWADATRCGRRSGCRSRWRWAWRPSTSCSPAHTRWTCISAMRRPSPTCRCCWR